MIMELFHQEQFVFMSLIDNQWKLTIKYEEQKIHAKLN